VLDHDDRDDESAAIIVIGADDSVGRIARGSGLPVLEFATVDEFDRWREWQTSTRATIRAEIVQALREIGVNFEQLPARLLSIFEIFARYRVVPAVADLERHSPSRRSLYRIWARQLRETPSRFLRRVRLLHAERLINSGASSKEAALRAGFGSVDRMRRLIAERRSARSLDSRS
jgi:AraC-like DNA-binding protein